MTHLNGGSGYTCSCDTPSQSPSSHYVICLQLIDIVALCLFSLAIWLFNMEYKSSLTARRTVPSQVSAVTTTGAETTAAAIVDTVACVDSSPSSSVCDNDKQPAYTDLLSPSASANSSRSSSSASSPAPNNASIDKAHQQVIRRVRRNRKLIRSNLQLTLTDPEDTDSEENLASLDYSSNFMSINYPTSPWDHNNLVKQSVIKSDNQSDSEQKKSKYISNPLNLPTDFTNSANGSLQSSSNETVVFNVSPTVSRTSEESNKNNCKELSIELTLNDVAGIRRALAIADLDSICIINKLTCDLLSEKICFTCFKVRFSLLGSRGKRCSLCQRVTCVKCSSQLAIGDVKLNRFSVSSVTQFLRDNKYQLDLREMVNKSTRPRIVFDCKGKSHLSICADCQYFLQKVSLN